MKRIAIILVITLSLLLLFSCGKNKKGSMDMPDAEITKPTEQKQEGGSLDVAGGENGNQDKQNSNDGGANAANPDNGGNSGNNGNAGTGDNNQGNGTDRVHDEGGDNTGSDITDSKIRDEG